MEYALVSNEALTTELKSYHLVGTKFHYEFLNFI